MEHIFLTKLEIKKVRHLKDITIELCDKEPRHLIFTGKNGSGKTSVLEAIANQLDMLSSHNDSVTLSFCKTSNDYLGEFINGNFLLAYYQDNREFHAEETEHIEKIHLQKVYGLTDTPRDQFVKYLTDLKVTEALAKTGTNTAKAEAIKKWFLQFEKMLRQIFEDSSLHLKFDEDSFSFFICQDGREPFTFNSMSSGFSAVMDIVLDLMMRMTNKKGRRFQFDLPGIVLIDEIETHLHLELQKQILKILTTLFPNIQFIVSTHSPFILNTLDNVVIYDLENHTLVNQKDGLTNLPYEGIVEGYFKVDKLSYFLKECFSQYKNLIHKSQLTDNDWEKIAELEMYLNEIPDYLALEIATEYRRLKLEFKQREDI